MKITRQKKPGPPDSYPTQEEYIATALSNVYDIRVDFMGRQVHVNHNVWLPSFVDVENYYDEDFFTASIRGVNTNYNFAEMCAEYFLSRLNMYSAQFGFRFAAYRINSGDEFPYPAVQIGTLHTSNYPPVEYVYFIGGKIPPKFSLEYKET